MPIHKPIRFRDPSIPEELKESIKMYTEMHPITTSVASVIFATVAMGGILTTALVAPNIFSAFGKMNANKKQRSHARYQQLWRNFYRMRRERLFSFVEERDGELIYELTERGRKKFYGFALETLCIATQSRWDGRWRVIAFDIPEKRRHARRALRDKLKSMGCYQLQKSIWVHPFPCDKEVLFLATYLRVKPYVHIWEISNIHSGKAIYYFRNILKQQI